jgi:hypothetical protein
MVLKEPRGKTRTWLDVASMTEHFFTVKAVAGGEVMMYETKVIRGESKSAFRDRRGNPFTKERLDDLAGEVLISRRLGGRWNHTLAQNAPNPKQAEALDRVIPWFVDRDAMSAAKQKFLSSWQVDATQIKSLFPGINAVSGKIQATFRKLERHEDQNCAVIEYKGQVKVRWGFDDDEHELATFDLDLTSHRAVTKGVNLKTEGGINVRHTGSMKFDGENVGFSIGGRLTFDSTVTILN